MTTYKEAVAEARKLVKRSEADQWRLAELTWEQVQAGKSRRQWARDIGKADSTVRYWFRMWERWGARGRARPSFPEAYNEIRGWTDDEHDSEYQRKAHQAIRNMPPERKAEVAAELLTEPEVAEQVIADPAARAATGRALDEHYNRERRLREQETPTAPPSTHDFAIEVLVRLRAISAAIKNATDLILSGPQLDAADDLRAVIAWQTNALGILDAALAGRSDMDAELAKILEEG
jgi:hypothetical protein